MSRTWWRWARLLGGVAILAVLVWRVGTGPFLDGIRTIDGWSLAAATGIALLTTVCCAWRWSLVARGLGVAVPMGSGVAAYYRSQFLNTTLPGGVLGDVHRGVRHGRDVGDVGRGLRAVGWERSAGQLVQIVLTVILLLVLPSPVRSSVPLIAAAVGAGALIILLLAWLLPHSGPSRWARAMRTACADIRHGLLARRAWPGILLRVDRGGGRSRRDVPDRGTDGRGDGAAGAVAPAGAAGAGGDGFAHQHRRLGTTRRRGRLGVRRGRVGRHPGRGDRRGLRRHGARRQPARRYRAARGLAQAASAEFAEFAAPRTGSRAQQAARGRDRVAGRRRAWLTAPTPC